MTVSTIQFITKTRLAELSRQRESLLSQYDAVETAGSGNDIRSLAKLCEGLKSVSISQVALHPELPNLKALFHGILAPQSLLDFWHGKLRIEIERGRLRANVVYLFGAVLSEWDEADTQVAGRIKERQNEQERILTSLTSPTAPPTLEFLNSLLSNFVVHREKIQERLAEWLKFSLDFKFCSTDILPWIATNPNFPQEVRLDAKRFEGDGELRSQLTEAIRVANRDPLQWSWPERGTSPRVLWTRNRWRLYPTPSLVELLSVNYCGDFWSEAIDGSYTNSALIPESTQPTTKVTRFECTRGDNS